MHYHDCHAMQTFSIKKQAIYSIIDGNACKCIILHDTSPATCIILMLVDANYEEGYSTHCECS